MKIVNESDLGRRRGGRGEGFRLDQVAAPPMRGVDWTFQVGQGAWEMASHAAAFLGMSPCPVCQGKPLRKTRYCLGCDRCGLDGRVEFPGLDVGQCLDPDWTTEPTVYLPRDDDLAGGTDRRPAPKSSRGLKAALRRRRSSA